MASFNDSYAKQLQELVTCAICLDHYQDPRLLPCSHTFCFPCIRNIVKNGSFTCPLRDDMKIDENDITQLPINRTVKDMVEFISTMNLSTQKKATQQCDNCNENQAINWCDKCAFHFCQSCTESIHSPKIFQSHAIVPLVEKVQSFCLDHSDEKLKYWCKQCEVLVCRDCLLFQHKDHTFSSLKEAASEAKTKFQETAQEIEEIKRNLTTFSETTKNIIDERHERVRQGKQNIEDTFANLQRILEERKCTMIKQLDDNELETMKILDQHQNTIDQHLNLTTVQELCIKKMLDSDDPMQILKFKSTLSHNYKDYTEQYNRIDEGYTVENYTFQKENKDMKEIVEKIAKLGAIISKSHTVKRNDTEMKRSRLDVSRVDGNTESITKEGIYARGYKFKLVKSLKLRSIEIHSNQIGQITGFVVNDAGIIIQTGSINSTNATMKWLKIPIECDVQNNYSVLVLTPPDNGSYTCKKGFSLCRMVNRNCLVESKGAHLVPQINVGSKVTVDHNIYSIDMILEVENQ